MSGLFHFIHAHFPALYGWDAVFDSRSENKSWRHGIASQTMVLLCNDMRPRHRFLENQKEILTALIAEGAMPATEDAAAAFTPSACMARKISSHHAVRQLAYGPAGTDGRN